MNAAPITNLREEWRLFDHLADALASVKTRDGHESGAYRVIVDAIKRDCPHVLDSVAHQAMA